MSAAPGRAGNRWVRPAAFVAPLAAASATLAAVGLVVADKVLAPPRRTRYRRRIVAVAPGAVRLARDDESVRPGTYGLVWPGGRAVLGEVLSADDSTVQRRILALDGALPPPGPADLEQVHTGDPRRALDLSFEDVLLDVDVGPVPAWVVPADGDTWAVVVHGWGVGRESCLDVLPMLHRFGITSIVPAYRNDPDAPSSPDRRYHLGADEWREVDAAMRHALGAGARRLVLYGWSMGGAIVLQALSRSPARGAVDALLLDSPVVDWRAVLEHHARARRIPRPVARLAMRVVEARIGLDFPSLDWVARADELDVPVLVFHGEGDPTVPFGASRDLALARPDLVTLISFEGAGHVASWNLDSTRYEAELRGFLDRTGGTGVRPR